MDKTLEQLQEEAIKLQQQASELQKKKQAEVLNEIRDVLNKYNYKIVSELIISDIVGVKMDWGVVPNPEK